MYIQARRVREELFFSCWITLLDQECLPELVISFHVTSGIDNKAFRVLARGLQVVVLGQTENSGVECW